MYDADIDGFSEFGCTLLFTVEDGLAIIGKPDAYSKDCQLEIVQYALKDKRDSITFIPEEE